MSVPSEFPWHEATVVVPGILKVVNTIAPAEGRPFQDEFRISIVELSKSANKDFINATLLHAEDTARLRLLETAIEKHLLEKARWLALSPPDHRGGLIADLAISTYQRERGEVLKAFHMLMEIRASTSIDSSDSDLHNMAMHNLKAMCDQAVAFFPAPIVWSSPPTTEQLLIQRKFWVYFMTL